jgi:hypothetical protein
MRTRKTVVVLVSGKAGSGKSTFSDLLESRLLDIAGISVFRYSFAGPLKFIAKAYIAWDGQKDEKGRKLLQDIGRVGRDYDQDIWVKHMLNQMDKKAGVLPYNFVIVDDWRFPNELAFLQKNPLLEIYTVRVARMNEDALPGNTGSDVSENSLPEIPDGLYNRFISNGGDYRDLIGRVDEVVNILTEQYILE